MPCSVLGLSGRFARKIGPQLEIRGMNDVFLGNVWWNFSGERYVTCERIEMFILTDDFSVSRGRY
jgi:hypothetical protein